MVVRARSRPKARTSSLRVGEVPALAEVLTEAGWQPPRLSGRALVHGHCHQKAVMGQAADTALLDATGLDWRQPDAGCCGLAGSFGFAAGEKYEISVAAGERTLGPAVRDAGEAIVVTDGFSCCTQIAHLAPDARPRHLAELLADGLVESSSAES